MLLVIGAIVAGSLLGLALGGSLRSLAEIRLRWWPLAVIGLAFQLAPVPTLEGSADHWIGVGLLIASYVALLAFVIVNIRLPGFALISVGFALNVLVISLNGGMPVSKQALSEAYGPGSGTVLTELRASGGAKHHLERPDDVLLPLTDVIALGAPVHLVMSVGDVLFFLGVTWVIAAATRGPTGRHAPVARDQAGRHRPGATRERLEEREPPNPRGLEPQPGRGPPSQASLGEPAAGRHRAQRP